MTSNHILAFLSFVAIGLLLTALGLSMAGMRLPTLIGHTMSWPSLSVPSLSRPSLSLPGLALSSGPGLPADVPVTLHLIVGFAAGWTLRWFYSLPWGALPRAIADCLLSWRRGATMLSLAVGCMAVLLLY